MYGKPTVLGTSIVGTTGALPFTGAPIGWYVAIGLVLVAVGLLVLRGATIRRHVGQDRAWQ